MEQGRGCLDSSWLFGLGGVVVRRVELAPDGGRVVHVVTAEDGSAACPDCGFVSDSVKEQVATRPKDLPYGPAPIAVVWHKRRLYCRQDDCPQKTFTERIGQVPARARTTRRLRDAAAQAVVAGRPVAEVADTHGLSWPTVQRAVSAYAARVLAEPAPTAVIGIDETRFGRPRWRLDAVTGRWVRTDPWETGIVDLAGGQGLLGQVSGRTSTTVTDWLNDRSQAFRDAVEVVALDPSAPYAAAVRTALPGARIAVDHFHLVALANAAVTAVRQRVTRAQLGRRGRGGDRTWANRRLLLRGAERLSARQLARMWNGCIDTDPSGHILSAWIAKEHLRELFALAARPGWRPRRAEINTGLSAFYTWCAAADIPELTKLATTIETWWPAIAVFLQTGITNAGTEGTNRLVKQTKRTACGFRNRDHYRHRVRLHINRPQGRNTARTSTTPAQS